MGATQMGEHCAHSQFGISAHLDGPGENHLVELARSDPFRRGSDGLTPPQW
jgi:hypothetical protein